MMTNTGNSNGKPKSWLAYWSKYFYNTTVKNIVHQENKYLKNISQVSEINWQQNVTVVQVQELIYIYAFFRNKSRLMNDGGWI